MALSDHEQKLLAQMEQALASEDPKLASTLRTPSFRVRTPKNILLGIFAIALGVAGLVAGVATQMPPIGVVGFVAVVTGLSIVVSKATASATSKAANQKNAKSKSNFIKGLENRWDSRNNEF